MNEAKYYFYTQNSGKDTVKSPLGMFTAYAIDNDLNYVVDKIRNYYELGDYKSDDEMNAADQAVASDLEKPDSKGRRTRGKKAESATPTDALEEKTGRTRKSMRKMKVEIKRNVNSRSLLIAKEEDLIKNLNPKITGWKNYYSTKTNEKWMQALDWYIICTFTRWYNKKHQRRKHMSRVGFVRNSIYEKGLKKMARA